MLLMLFKGLLRKRRLEEEQDGDSTGELVLKIQAGDARLREQFLADYRPYVAKLASRVTGRYVDPLRDDEFSIALAAFNEAIDRYSPSAGPTFLSFAETVVRARLIDYFRKEQKFLNQIPYSAFEGEDEERHPGRILENREAMEQYRKEETAFARQQEILELSRQLAEFGITFQDLVRASPKHRDSREALLEVARFITEDETLMALLLRKKMLPIKNIMLHVKVSQKTLERNRKYIIAAVLILSGTYPCLKEYLKIPPNPNRKE